MNTTHFLIGNHRKHRCKNKMNFFLIFFCCTKLLIQKKITPIDDKIKKKSLKKPIVFFAFLKNCSIFVPTRNKHTSCLLNK
ncbi:hypothetical protein AsAng_0030230 [Aureispira anguillae]|uniref:Uncharacterized protein n=1 Tax=Aureispira anguillae TaxID=2864201 RepID=A0A915YG18_9BACT|nr:hypothetical protein AsAng_0030230 [Aureispira anguillae]